MERFGAIVRWLRVRRIIWQRPLVPIRPDPAAAASAVNGAAQAAEAHAAPQAPSQDSNASPDSTEFETIPIGFRAPSDPPLPYQPELPEWVKRPTAFDLHVPADIPPMFRYDYRTHYDPNLPEHAEMIQAQKKLDEMINPNEDQAEVAHVRARSVLDLFGGPPQDGTFEAAIKEAHEARRWHGQDAIRQRQRIFGPFLDRALELGEIGMSRDLNPTGPPSRWWYLIRPFWTWKQRALFHDLDLAQDHQLLAASRLLYPPERAARVRFFHSFFTHHDPDLFLQREREIRMELDALDESIDLDKYLSFEGKVYLFFAEEYEANRLKASIANAVAAKQLPDRPIMARHPPRNNLQMFYKQFVRLSNIPHPQYDIMFNQMSWILLRGRLRPIMRTKDEIEQKVERATWSSMFHQYKKPKDRLKKRSIKHRLRKKKKTPHGLMARSAGRMRRTRWKYWAHIKRSLFDQRLGLPWPNPSWLAAHEIRREVRALEIADDRLRRGEVDTLWDGWAAAIETVDAKWDKRVDATQELLEKHEKLVKDPEALAAELMPYAKDRADTQLQHQLNKPLFNPQGPPLGPVEGTEALLASQRTRAEEEAAAQAQDQAAKDAEEYGDEPEPEDGPPRDPNEPVDPADPSVPKAPRPPRAPRPARQPEFGDFPDQFVPPSPSASDMLGVNPLAGQTGVSNFDAADALSRHKVAHEAERMKRTFGPAVRAASEEGKAEQAKIDAARMGKVDETVDGAKPTAGPGPKAPSDAKAAPDAKASPEATAQAEAAKQGGEEKGPEEEKAPEAKPEEQQMDNNVREVVTAALDYLKKTYHDDVELSALTLEELVIRSPAEIMSRTGMAPSVAVQALNLKPEHGTVLIKDVEEAAERMFELNSPEKGGSLYIQSKFPVAQSVFDLLPQAGPFYIVLPDPPKAPSAQDQADGKAAAAPRPKMYWQEDAARKRAERLANAPPEEKDKPRFAKRKASPGAEKKPWEQKKKRGRRRRGRLGRKPSAARRPRPDRPAPKKGSKAARAPRKARKGRRHPIGARLRRADPAFQRARRLMWSFRQRKIPKEAGQRKAHPLDPVPIDARMRSDLQEYKDYRAQFRVDEWALMTDAEFHATVEPFFRTKGRLAPMLRRYVKPIPARPVYPNQDELWHAIQAVRKAGEEIEALLAPFRASPFTEVPAEPTPPRTLDDLFSNPDFLSYAFEARDFASAMGFDSEASGYIAFPSEARDEALRQIFGELVERQLLVSADQGPLPPVQPSCEPNPLEIKIVPFARRFDELMAQLQHEYDIGGWRLKDRRQRAVWAKVRALLVVLQAELPQDPMDPVGPIFSIRMTRQQMEVRTIEWFAASEELRAKAQFEFIAAVPAYLAEVEQFKQRLATMTPPSQPVPYGIVPTHITDRVFSVVELQEIKTVEDRRSVQEWLAHNMLTYKLFQDKQIEINALRKTMKEKRDAANWAKYNAKQPRRAKRGRRGQQQQQPGAEGQPTDQQPGGEGAPGAGADGQQQQQEAGDANAGPK